MNPKLILNMKNFRTLTAIVLSAGMLGSCSAWKDLSNQDKGVAIGAGGGAVAGGVIGKATGGNPAVGAAIGAVVGGVAGGIIGHKMDKQAEEIKKTVPGVDVERVGEGIVLNFSEKVLFSTGKSELTSASKNALDKLVTVLSKYNQTDLKILGHTDNVGSDSYNQDLSDRRASAVAAYLRTKGIGSSRISTLGYGETAPKCDNATADGRACNRRVEFSITANEAMKSDAAKEAGQ
jgi:outer membrane protein OmpA-like peptidoglycan-associated protein